MSSYSDDDSLAIELFIPSLGARDHSSECKSVCLLVWLTLFWLANFKDFLLWLYRNWRVRVCETTFREIACFQKAHSGVSPLSLLALRAAVVHFRWTPCFYCRTYICTASSGTVWADWQKASSPFSLWSRCKKVLQTVRRTYLPLCRWPLLLFAHSMSPAVAPSPLARLLVARLGSTFESSHFLADKQTDRPASTLTTTCLFLALSPSLSRSFSYSPAPH